MRRLTLFFAKLSIFILSAGDILGQAPPNDHFANRVILNGTNISVAASNEGASKESGEPNHANNPGGKSLWWIWTAPGNGDLVVNTDGSDFDTLLGVYTGSSLSSLGVVASNDDHGASVIDSIVTNGLFSTSRVRFSALTGTQYQIAVDGFNGGADAASGTVNLTLTFLSEPITRPTNDNFSNHLVLAGDSVTTTLSNVNATREPGEPHHATRMGDTSVWWIWTPRTSGTIKITTDGSQFDTVLAVYTGSSLASLALVASNDDEDPVNALLTSAVFFDAVAGQTYQIAVDGFDGASGQISLAIASAKTRLIDPTLLGNGTFRFTLSGLAGRTNEVQISDDLSTWTALTNVLNASGSVTFTDSPPPGLLRRYYRTFLK